MLRLSVKSVRGHLIRFLLTALAVTLGVAFVAGSYILSASINNTLDSLIDSASKGSDVVIRGAEVKGPDGNGPRPAVQMSLADKLASVDGVAKADADIQGLAMMVGKDGLVVRNGGAPTFGFPFRSDSPSFKLIAGQGPTGPGEVVVEKSTLEKSGLKVGDTTKAVIGSDARTVRISGEVEFGSLFGATAILVDEATARSAFAADGKVQTVTLTAKPGVTQTQLRDRVASLVPAGDEAVTGDAVKKETQDAIGQGLGFFTTFMLVFAWVTLFVGGFIIVNTFSILLAQRTRELALLRAVGASRGQVVRMVLGEAALIGVVGSALGIAVGAGLAAVLKSVMKSLVGIDIAGGLPITAETVIRSILTGTVVTLVSALLPARRASRIPPVAAMRDDMVMMTASSLRRRGVIGIVVLALGGALLATSVTRTEVPWGLVGLGAALLVIGALVAAPLAARPVVQVITWPVTVLGGVVGRLARQNSLRVPRRTANTASALMIGLALVTGLGVMAQSIKASTASLLEKQLTTDYVLNAGNAPVPAGVAKKAAELPDVASSTPMSRVDVAVGKTTLDGTAATTSGMKENVRLVPASGTLPELTDGTILINEKTAKDNKWSVGTSVVARVGTLTGQKLTVAGIYKDNELMTGVMVDRNLYFKAVPATEQMDDRVLIKAKPGTDLNTLRTELTDVVKPYLVVSVQNGDDYVNAAGAQIDQLLGLLYVLLALAILIAVLGIINTLALSVVERTREIGLLRAIGLGRNQLARMITVEAVATAVFGAVLGAALGLGLGIAGQHGLSNDGLSTLAIPWAIIISVLVISAIVGVLSAALPAIRAVRLNVLRAIATD